MAVRASCGLVHVSEVQLMASPSRLRDSLVCGGGVLLVGLAVWSGAPGIRAQGQTPRTTPFSYTDAQAERGRAVYSTSCASCHGPNLDDGPFAPPLKGVDFRTKWGSGRRESLDPLFTTTATRMPPDRPGGLGDAT